MRRKILFIVFILMGLGSNVQAQYFPGTMLHNSGPTIVEAVQGSMTVKNSLGQHATGSPYTIGGISDSWSLTKSPNSSIGNCSCNTDGNYSTHGVKAKIFSTNIIQQTNNAFGTIGTDSDVEKSFYCYVNPSAITYNFNNHKLKGWLHLDLDYDDINSGFVYASVGDCWIQAVADPAQNRWDISYSYYDSNGTLHTDDYETVDEEFSWSKNVYNSIQDGELVYTTAYAGTYDYCEGGHIPDGGVSDADCTAVADALYVFSLP